MRGHDSDVIEMEKFKTKSSLDSQALSGDRQREQGK